MMTNWGTGEISNAWCQETIVLIAFIHFCFGVMQYATRKAVVLNLKFIPNHYSGEAAKEKPKNLRSCLLEISIRLFFISM